MTIITTHIVKNGKTISVVFLLIAIALCICFLFRIEFSSGFASYFEWEYYNQFGPLALSIEFLIAGYYLLVEHEKTNFALAVFGFTALLDPFFDQIGLFESLVPLYGTIVLSICAIVCLWMAFRNIFKLKRLSLFAAFASLVLGCLIELFFNNFW